MNARDRMQVYADVAFEYRQVIAPCDVADVRALIADYDAQAAYVATLSEDYDHACTEWAAHENRADKAEASLGRMREAFKREHDWRIEAEADLKALRDGVRDLCDTAPTHTDWGGGQVVGAGDLRALLSDTGEGT